MSWSRLCAIIRFNRPTGSKMNSAICVNQINEIAHWQLCGLIKRGNFLFSGSNNLQSFSVQHLLISGSGKMPVAKNFMLPMVGTQSKR